MLRRSLAVLIIVTIALHNAGFHGLSLAIGRDRNEVHAAHPGNHIHPGRSYP